MWFKEIPNQDERQMFELGQKAGMIEIQIKRLKMGALRMEDARDQTDDGAPQFSAKPVKIWRDKTSRR